MIVFTPIHPLTGAPLSGALGTATMVPADSSGVKEKRNGISFMLPDQRVDRILVDANAPGRRPPTEAEIQQILKCGSRLDRGCFETSLVKCYSPCDTALPTYNKGLRRFSVGSVNKYLDSKTGLVVVVKNTSPLETAYDFVKDNICWIAAGTMVATGTGATMAVKVKMTCDAVRAAMSSGGGAPAPGFDPGFDPGAGGGGEKSWISKHPVATGAIAVGGMGAIGAVLMAIFRR